MIVRVVRRRRAIAMVIAIALLLLLSLISAIVVRQSIAMLGATARQLSHLQAEHLATAAADRASLLREADPAFAGDTWKPTTFDDEQSRAYRLQATTAINVDDRGAPQIQITIVRETASGPVTLLSVQRRVIVRTKPADSESPSDDKTDAPVESPPPESTPSENSASDSSTSEPPLNETPANSSAPQENMP